MNSTVQHDDSRPSAFDQFADPLDGQILDAMDTQPAAMPAPARNLGHLMRKIPVTLTLELGSTRICLEDLANLSADSVLELDAIVGEPLTIRVNGVSIGKGEVVVSGENYGLKVVEISDLSLDSLSA